MTIMRMKTILMILAITIITIMIASTWQWWVKEMQKADMKKNLKKEEL